MAGKFLRMKRELLKKGKSLKTAESVAAKKYNAGQKSKKKRSVK